jgi:PAS domain S-box-containing protein
MASTSGPIRILHVDDDPDFADLTATYLEREDDSFDVETEHSAEAGLKRLDGDVDGIVSDYDMPGTNGIEFLEQVRDRYPDLPFILFTGKGSESVASDAISAGVTDYLQKSASGDQYALLANRLQNAVERYGAEREVEITRERFRKLLADSGDYIHIMTPDGTVEYVTPSVERVLGYDKETLEGSDAFDVTHPADVEAAREEFERVLENPDRDSTIEVRIADATGEWRWIEVKSRNLVTDPAIQGVVGNVRDVTERKERERALERQRTRFSALFENFPEPTLSYEYQDGEPVIRAVNEAFVDTFGFDPGEAVDTPVDDLIVPSERLEEARDIDRRVREGRFVDEEVRRLTADGTRHFTFRNIPIEEGAEGFAVYIDVEDRKTREQALERQNERLEAFTTIVSHDLRNPLSVASGSLELGREEHDNEHFERVASALDRMEALVADLLTLARQGDDVGDIETVDLAGFTRDCWGNVDTDGAALDVDADLTIEADPTRLKQLLENLVGNAVEHGGERVRVGRLGDDEGFFVADDGPGIPESARGTVFEAGYTTRDEGTGFGLTIVQEIASAHGWSVDVTESDAGGARVEIRDVSVVGT